MAQALGFMAIALYCALAVLQIPTPQLLTAGNMGSVVIYAYVIAIAVCALGIAARSKIAWAIALGIEVSAILVVYMERDFHHAREFSRVTLMLAAWRIVLLLTPWLWSLMDLEKRLGRRSLGTNGG